MRFGIALGLLLISLISLTVGCVNTAVMLGGTLDCALSAAEYEVPPLKEGRFPYSLSYAVNDQIVEIQDTLSCKYVGRKCNLTGWHSKWERKSETGIDEINLMQVDLNSQLSLTPISCLSFVRKAGSEDYSPSAPEIVLIRDRAGGRTTLYIKPEEALEAYGAKIISWKTPDPDLQYR